MKFLIVGFFRSGTTLLANIINSHPNAHCIYDPFIFLLQTFRNKLKKKLKIQISKTAEDLENHLIDKNSNNKLFKYINKKENIDLKISKKEIIKLDKIIKQKKIYQHPNIKKIKIKNTITTFRELIIFTSKFL